MLDPEIADICRIAESVANFRLYRRYETSVVFMLSRCDACGMPEKKTVRIHKEDKERLTEIAEATGQNLADVIAEYVREPTYICPECGDPFDPSEIEPETIKEHGMLSTSVDKLVKGQRDVKSFECPSCGERIRPKDIEAAGTDEFDANPDGVTASDMGVTGENSKDESASKGA